MVAREEERRRLRWDIHDDIGPALAALAPQAEAAQTLAPDDPSAAAALVARLVPRLKTAVGDVRALVHELRPPILDELGLEASVKELALRMSTPEVSVRAEATDLPELSAALDVAAYRIVAEAVTNAIRHADASLVAVSLMVADGTLDIEVADDGCGLPTDPVHGLGLASMRLRAEELGGELSMSTTGRGTSVIVRIPVATAGVSTVPVPAPESVAVLAGNPRGPAS